MRAHGVVRPGRGAPPTSPPGGSSRRARAAASRWRRDRSPRTHRSTRATSTPRPSSRRSTSARPTRARPASTVTALRYHNVYGPRMPRDTPYAGVASIFRSRLAAGRAPRVFEDGGQRRDFVHVRDVARANVLALTAAEPGRPAPSTSPAARRTPCSRWRARSPTRATAPPEAPMVTGEWRARRRAPHRRLARARRRGCSASGAGGLRRRDARVRALAAPRRRPV